LLRIHVPSGAFLERELTIVASRNSNCAVYTDGGARGNPGPAAAGGVILTEDGTVVAELSEFLGVATNNVAEYQALALTLRRAMALGFTHVTVHMDSELIVRQLNGIYRVKDPKMLELYGQVRKLLREFSDWKVVHVPRSENKHADELVNAALDAQSAQPAQESGS
jgi:ribonuclease HI